MIGFVIFIHVIVCALLIILILIQAGRGGGLVESFSSVESMFGPKTNAFLTRTTTVLSILFFITCLSLAFLSTRQSRSLIRNTLPLEQPIQKTAAETAPLPAAPTGATTQPAQAPQTPNPEPGAAE